jgi:hypothetical protein
MSLLFQNVRSLSAVSLLGVGMGKPASAQLNDTGSVPICLRGHDVSTREP